MDFLNLVSQFVKHFPKRSSEIFKVRMSPWNPARAPKGTTGKAETHLDSSVLEPWPKFRFTTAL